MDVKVGKFSYLLWVWVVVPVNPSPDSSIYPFVPVFGAKDMADSRFPASKKNSDSQRSASQQLPENFVTFTKN